MRLLETSTLGLDGPMLCGPTPGFSTVQLAGSRRTPPGFFRIEGYTDGSGTREQNLSIGEKRARFVMKYLMSKGVEAARITIASYGVQLPCQGTLSMRVPIGMIAVLFLCAFPTDIHAEPLLHSQDFQTKASFDLTVQKSMVLKLGKSRLETKSAFVTYTNEFFAGKTNALKVQFFTQPIVEETQAKLLKHDNREVSKGGYAALVLFLDERDQIWQANLTYVIPGTTVVRTVASSRDELTKYFSDYHFDRSRLRLKSRGTYNTAPDSKDDGLTLSWDTNLDIRVFDQIKK